MVVSSGAMRVVVSRHRLPPSVRPTCFSEVNFFNTACCGETIISTPVSVSLKTFKQYKLALRTSTLETFGKRMLPDGNEVSQSCRDLVYNQQVHQVAEIEIVFRHVDGLNVQDEMGGQGELDGGREDEELFVRYCEVNVVLSIDHPVGLIRVQHTLLLPLVTKVLALLEF